MQTLVDLHSSRARQARLAKRMGQATPRILVVLAVLSAAGSGYLFYEHQNLAWSLAGLAIWFYLPAVWCLRQLQPLPPTGNSLTERLSGETLARLNEESLKSPKQMWQALQGNWQQLFVTNHLLLTSDFVAAELGDDPAELSKALEIAAQIADEHDYQAIELGLVAAGLLAASPEIKADLIRQKDQPEDVLSLGSVLARTLDGKDKAKQNYGGIGRDWAFGFTPLLNRFGHNVSREVMDQGAHFDWLAESPNVKAIEAAFEHRTSAVALVGPEGIGKTSDVYALAQRLIEGNTVPALAYHQIISINATQIISAVHEPGRLENLMLSLASEAAQAGHVVIFFDDAQLFFMDGAGAVDASQILLTILQARALPIILALTPPDWQRLRSKNPNLAGLMTPIILAEPSEAEVMRILEDASLGMEHQQNVLIAYNALREAYRLSGRYEQDEAYPGKAIKLLEHSITHAKSGVVTAESVQKAIEQTRGVKAGSAAPAEADQLLHLEDKIHERMINQTHAVSVVSNALRRARAGVTNPKRPIGSFLFLGPTGVGKTELAKAIASTYFGAESSMIRLDMSEYQQPDDVQRLLATGQNEASSLLLQVRQQPFSVVLLDEIEKAHPNILNLLLQLLDEGQLTDANGRPASFKDCIIIATSNAGANTIREKIAAGQTLESFAEEFSDELINSGQFKPELINRFDDMVLFRPLNPDELAQVVKLMLGEINQTLTNQNIKVDLTDAAVAEIVARGNDPRLGARPMRRALQKAVEDTIAKKILAGQANPGDTITLDVSDLAS
ncbi:MAG TPA: AAA family ATPase [Candidatus Saccharimonadales bacterium]|nr:AAA family ATPase [Candidatus Saccharimonadales bacterium]